ncbi:MAG: hypothetical protein HRU19_03810 [Pseudobacteriovorax sp.]|nr:hypothetical protein [Pseudobacteriovorax sp.]
MLPNNQNPEFFFLAAAYSSLLLTSFAVGETSEQANTESLKNYPGVVVGLFEDQTYSAHEPHAYATQLAYAPTLETTYRIGLQSQVISVESPTFSSYSKSTLETKELAASVSGRSSQFFWGFLASTKDLNYHVRIYSGAADSSQNSQASTANFGFHSAKASAGYQLSNISIALSYNYRKIRLPVDRENGGTTSQIGFIEASIAYQKESLEIGMNHNEKLEQDDTFVVGTSTAYMRLKWLVQTELAVRKYFIQSLTDEERDYYKYSGRVSYQIEDTRLEFGLESREPSYTDENSFSAFNFRTQGIRLGLFREPTSSHHSFGANIGIHKGKEHVVEGNTSKSNTLSINSVYQVSF